jgi:hypothetical protein
MTKRRRTNPNNKFVMLERWFWRCPAWQALPHPARSLYVELEMLYTGGNNGEIALSVRQAMERIRCSFNFTCKMFRELEEKGFAKPSQRGSFTWKARHATTWILTLHEYQGRPGSKEFMQWKPTEKQNTDSPRESDGLAARVRGVAQPYLTDSPQESVRADLDPLSDSPQESLIVYHLPPSSLGTETESKTPAVAGAVSANRVNGAHDARAKSVYRGRPILRLRALELMRSGRTGWPWKLSDLACELKAHPVEAGRALRELCQQGLAERIDHGRYMLTEDIGA